VKRSLDKQDRSRSPADASKEEPAKVFARSPQRRRGVDHVRCTSSLVGLAAENKPTIVIDMPTRMPPMNSEAALWRAFLADEIEAILKYEEI